MSSHIQNLPLDQLVQTIRYMAQRGQDIRDHFLAYYRLTGIDQAYMLIPYTPEETMHDRGKLAANRKVNRAVHLAKLHLRHLFLEKPRELEGVIQGSMGLGGERGSIRVEPDDLPQARMAVDYSGAPLQGKYMGSKTKHLTKRRMIVTYG